MPINFQYLWYHNNQFIEHQKIAFLIKDRLSHTNTQFFKVQSHDTILFFRQKSHCGNARSNVKKN